MDDFKEIKSIFEFPGKVIQAFDDILCVELKVVEDSLCFDTVIPFESPISMNMGLNNDDFKSILCLGISNEFLEGVLGDYTKEMAFDALGEVLNTVGGLLADEDDIIENYGELIQVPPRKLDTNVIYPRGEALYCDIESDGFVISIGFLIKPAISAFLKRIMDKKNLS